MTAKAIPARIGRTSQWVRWAPYAVVVWALVYSVMGLYWAVGGRGFPYDLALSSDMLSPLAGKFGPAVAWIFVAIEGIPAVAVGVLMLRGVRRPRLLLIAAGVLLAGILLLLMTGLNLLIEVGYIPAAIVGLMSAERSQAYLAGWAQWATIHQLLCLAGGFLWLAATVSYYRRSADACLYCGRRDDLDERTNKINAARLGRVAVSIAMIAPVFYAFTRIAWALGIPLGMTEEALRRGQETGTWIGGLSLATFCLVGAVLMLGLVQRWGEVFPRWMIGLAGRRVPMALVVILASLASVLLFVGGIGIWSALPQMAANVEAAGITGSAAIAELIFQVGPTLLFPLWGAALAVATVAYYYRRRGPCSVCGRGTPADAGELLADHNSTSSIAY